MSRPESVLICGQPFTVKWDPAIASRLMPESEGWYELGTTNVQRQELIIRGVDQAWHYERDTVLHEVVHAILRLTSQTDRFKPYELDEKHPEEPVVYALSTALLGVLRANPGLVSYLTEEPTPSSRSGGSGGEAR